MIVVHLNGGLGNQLFQYASAKALSLHQQVPLLLEINSFYRTELPDLEVPRDFEMYNFQGVDDAIISKEALALIKPKLTDKILPRHKRVIYIPPHYHYDPNFFKAGKNVYLKGLWQSEKYFADYKNELLRILVLKDELINRVKDKANEFASQPTVGVHIRRGDYLRKPIILEWHGVL